MTLSSEIRSFVAHMRGTKNDNKLILTVLVLISLPSIFWDVYKSMLVAEGIHWMCFSRHCDEGEHIWMPHGIFTYLGQRWLVEYFTLSLQVEI